jgi:hypothetical protein
MPDRELWLIVRRSLLAIIKAFDAKYGVDAKTLI